MLILISVCVVLLIAVALGYAVDTHRRVGKLRRDLRARIDRVQNALLITNVLSSPRYRDPRHLCHFEAQVYAQHGEDGIISEILRRVGETNRHFVEMGAGSGRENNTLYRLSLGWSGHWFEADPGNLRRIGQVVPKEIAAQRLRVVEARLTAENVAPLLQQHHVPSAFDLLSLDIDLNTSHVWRALRTFAPRIVVIEYNASIPPSDEWEVEYRSDAAWEDSNYFGASLKRLEILGRELGYVLVACELSGTNAFFVRQDLVDDQFAGPFSAEALYEPPRYYLVGDRGHRSRYGPAAQSAVA